MKCAQDGSSAIMSAAIASTILIVIAIIIFFSKSAWILKANELGDFLAGFGTILAFIWLIATIILQKGELSLQRRELSLQRQEMRRLADEAGLQSAALTASARSIFVSRWDQGVIRFLKTNEESIRKIISEVSKIYIDRTGNTIIEEKARVIFEENRSENHIFRRTTPAISWPASRIFPKDQKTAVVALSAGIEYLDDALDRKIVINDVVEITFDIDVQELFSRINIEIIKTGYIEALVNEAVSLGLGAMIENYDIRPVMNESVNRANADFVQLICSSLASKAQTS